MYDNNLKKMTSLEHKNYVKYLGILVDSNLSWQTIFHRKQVKVLESFQGSGILCLQVLF